MYRWPIYHPVERAPIRLDAAVLAAYAGRYEAHEPGAEAVLAVHLQNGQLFLQSPATGGQELALYPLAPNRFFMLEENAEIRFERDARGAVTRLVAQTAHESLTARRLPQG